jgi:hypothetical protein
MQGKNNGIMQAAAAIREMMQMSEEKAERSPYTVVEAAAKLNMSEFAMRATLRRGALRGFKLGRDWRVLPTPVDRLVGEPTARKS